MTRYSMFRDDDISVTTDFGLLRDTHALFVKYNRLHTVAVQMKNLWDNKEVWFFLMTAGNLAVGLHGWDHVDYGRMSQECIEQDIDRSLAYWKLHSERGKHAAPAISVFFPPWNSSSPALEAACATFGLAVDTRWNKDSGVYGFHSWEMSDYTRRARLEKALQA